MNIDLNCWQRAKERRHPRTGEISHRQSSVAGPCVSSLCSNLCSGKPVKTNFRTAVISMSNSTSNRND